MSFQAHIDLIEMEYVKTKMVDNKVKVTITLKGVEAMELLNKLYRLRGKEEIK